MAAPPKWSACPNRTHSPRPASSFLHSTTIRHPVAMPVCEYGKTKATQFSASGKFSSRLKACCIRLPVAFRGAKCGSAHLKITYQCVISNRLEFSLRVLPFWEGALMSVSKHSCDPGPALLVNVSFAKVKTPNCTCKLFCTTTKCNINITFQPMRMQVLPNSWTSKNLSLCSAHACTGSLLVKF